MNHRFLHKLMTTKTTSFKDFTALFLLNGLYFICGLSTVQASDLVEILKKQPYQTTFEVALEDSLYRKESKAPTSLYKQSKKNDASGKKSVGIFTERRNSSEKGSFSNDKNHDFKFNKDAVKLIQFDFTPREEENYKPQLAPLDKKWMDFQVDLAVPKSMIDTTKIRRPKNYLRMNPYSIWTHYGENPVYDVLVFGNAKRFKMHMDIDLSKIETYSRQMAPITGKYNQTTYTGSSAVIADLDFIGFLYYNFNKQGRIRKHNRKYANAWKTYNNSTPSLILSLNAKNNQVPNYNLIQAPEMPYQLGANSTDYPSKSDLSFSVDSTSYKQDKEGREVQQGDNLAQERNKNLKKKKNRIYRRSQIITKQQKDDELKDLPNNMEDLYKYIREKQVQDSIKRKEIFRIDKADQNIYELEQQQRKLKEQQN